MGDNMDPAKMKVVELRAELSSRGLDTKGNKAALVDRLREALEKETGNEIQETSIMETSTEESFHEDREAEDPPLSHRDKRQKLEEPDVAAQSYGENGNVRIKEEPDRSDYYPKQEIQEREPMIFKEEKQQLQSVKSEDKYENKVKDEMQMGNNLKTEVKTEPQTYEERRGEKRSHSPPPGNVYTFYKEDEPDYDEKAVMLSWYDSDLNLVIDKKNFCVATPMYEQGFGYVWAGARASYGFKQGKVFYEVKILENCDVSHLEDEPSPHVVRIGWSVIGTSMQLGEEPMSYGFGGTGKISTDCKFKDYGKPFTEGDVVGAFLDMDSKSITMSYTVNGNPMGVAYTIPHSHLDGRALYPHVLTKNSKFECNFGDKEPWFQPLPGYMFVGEVPFERRIAGPARPARREDCEMLMMCGLPACGKTTWANDWYAKNLDNMYNILGTNSLIDKMKVMGLPRKRNYAGRWDVLIEKCSKCLNKLFEIGGRRRRNYILDQTNVYPNAQRRKMKGFEGFVRRAIVIVPTDEEFKRRCALQEKVEGKDVPDSAVLEMKANFELPCLGDPFDEVRFEELQESEAQALIDQYRKEAADAGYTPQKLQRGRGFRNRGGGGNNFRGGFQSKASSGGGGGDRNRGSSGGGGGGGGGNWQQKKEESSASDSWREKIQQFGSGRSNGPSGGGSRDGGGSNWRGGRGGRGNDHRGRSDSYSSRGSDSYGGRDSYSSRGSDSSYDRNRSSGGRDGGYSGNRNQSGGGKGNWGSGYNQGGGSGGSGGGGGSWSSSSGDGGSGSWGQQGYGQQGSWGGGQQNYGQQGWKGGYGQQSSGYSGQGGYGQQQSYGQQGYGGSGGGGGTGGGAGGAGANWNQQYYGGTGGNQGYGGSTQGAWGQSGDGGGGGYGSGYGQQQSTWQGYGQGYGYGQGQQPK